MNFIKSELEKSIDEICKHELTLFLDYECYDRSGNKDYKMEVTLVCSTLDMGYLISKYREIV